MSKNVYDILHCVKTEYPDGFQVKNYKRGEYLIRAGQVEHFSYHILSGAVKAVLENKDRSHTIRFGYKGSILNALPSFFDDSPSLFHIVALKSSVVECYSKKAIYKCMDMRTSFKEAYIKILEEMVGQFVEREIDLLTPDPRERYRRILSRNPEVFQEIPLRHIADYLRMTPETLSRLRKS